MTREELRERAETALCVLQPNDCKQYFARNDQCHCFTE